MGISASTRVKTTLSNSSEFDAACDSTYSHCLSLSQHAFPGIPPYQLLTAATHLHNSLSSIRFPIVLKWLPTPPNRSQVDSAFRFIANHSKIGVPKTEDENELCLGSGLFKEWAVVVFTDAVVSNATKTVLSRIPVGIAGIVGVGAVTRSGKDLVGAAVGVYALGVATSIYLSLSG